MDPRQKKTTRDLSDLKSRLGLAKPAAAQPAPGAQGQPAAPKVGKSTGPLPAQQALSGRLGQPVSPAGMVVPPPGVMPPGGYPQPQPAPPPDVRRDPFAAAAATAYPTAVTGPAPIVDAGPPIEIPQEKKSHGKLLIALAITAAIPLFVGYAGGRIWAARVTFNKTIDDAKLIDENLKKISAVNMKVAVVIQKSQARGGGQLKYDEQLLEGLKDVLRASPAANPERAKKTQDELFRTNYAMMDGIVIDRLFNYFNNSLRLYQELEAFIQKSERTAELIKTYDPEGDKGQQKYGVVFASDEGNYYLGSLVEVGNIDCAKPEARECKKEDIKGFMVRVGTGSWSARPGKPAGKKAITEIVVPIIPDENWQRVAVGKKGFMEYREYTNGLGRLAAICGLLGRDEKPLMQDLSKAGNRARVFAPGCSVSPAE